jgi:hypothetical protein
MRIYECELPPYKQPKYFPVRIFSLEYIRQMINSDDIQFVAFKKNQQLRIKGQIGSFICNNIATREEAHKMLKEMNFSLIFPWHYDPCGIITETKIKNNISTYAHVPKPEIERFMNHTEWEEKNLLYIEQQPSTSIISHTGNPQVQEEKRPKKHVSPLVIEVLANNF